MVKRIETFNQQGIGRIKESYTNKAEISFREVFESKLRTSQINVSKHAQERILLRGIEIGEKEVDGINKAIELAGSKGVRDSLVIVNGKAFVINVPTRTIITAIEEEDLKNRIFTNIDGAVIL
ncbi:MAG: flagellar protein [bacterium]|nr:flagellar protein [bacterium]